MSDISEGVTKAIKELDTGIAIIEEILTDEQYRTVCSESFLGKDTLGNHWRHVLDFYTAFLDGYKSKGRVDYTKRQDNPVIKQDRMAGVTRGKEVRNLFVEFGKSGRDCPMDVTAEYGGGMSSVKRELALLASHTNHHIATMKVVCGYNGIDIPGRAGWSPSTVKKQVYINTLSE